MLRQRFLLLRRPAAMLVLLVLALLMGPGVHAAVALPHCDRPDPPPICDGEPRPNPRGKPIGHLDSVVSTPDGLEITGWALDPDTTAPIDVNIRVDHRSYTVRANSDRPDVGALYPKYGNAHGFTHKLDNRLHHRVCAYGINVGRLSDDGALGCGRVQRTVSVLNLNIAGLGDQWANDDRQGHTGIPWRDRYRRIPQWLGREGKIPDIIVLQEMPTAKLWTFLPLDVWDPDPYEAHTLMIRELKTRTGANYRIAYSSSDTVAEGLNRLYQGRSVIYNAERLNNTTAELAARVSSTVISDLDLSTQGVQVRSSWPCLAAPADCSLLDGDGRHIVEAHIDTVQSRWVLGASAAAFELKSEPGKHILVFNGHMHPYNAAENTGDPGDAPGLRDLVDRTWTAMAPVQKLIPPIIGADFNGTPQLLDDFIYDLEQNVSGVDAVLLGRFANFPASYRPVFDGESYPNDTPRGGHPHCGTIASMISDHCAVYTQFLPSG